MLQEVHTSGKPLQLGKRSWLVRSIRTESYITREKSEPSKPMTRENSDSSDQSSASDRLMNAEGADG